MPAATGAISRFERIRHMAGFLLAPLAFAAAWFADLGPMSEEAHRLAAVMSAVMVLWVCESLPMPVTALAGAAACVMLGVAKDRAVFAPFADPLMFLFIGSFMLARAIFLHGLDRRVALGVLSLSWVDARPSRILFAFGAVTAAASAWISNTAMTAMMFAIGLSILQYLMRDQKGAAATGRPAIDPRFATGIMLMTSFSASIGGLATPVGTPPNVIGIRQIELQTGVGIPFFTWMLIGVPVVIVLYLILFSYMNWLSPAGVKKLPESREAIAAQREALGPWTIGQASTLFAFVVTVILWLTPGVVALAVGEDSAEYDNVKTMLPESVAAILGATLLFILPGGGGKRAIAWRDAVQIDWGVVLLYGGGVVFGVLAASTGLTEAVAKGAETWLPATGGVPFLIAVCLIAVLVSETMSNTASATIVVPLVAALAKQLDLDPIPPAIAATMACSLGFMLPVSTPCNAIVYGSGYIPLGRMIRYGFLLDVAGIVVIVTMVTLLGPILPTMPRP